MIVNCGYDEHDESNIGDWGSCTCLWALPQIYTITRTVIIETQDGDGGGGPPVGDPGPGGGGNGGENYNPNNIPAFNPDTDFGPVKGNITKPIIIHETPEQAFYNSLDDDDPNTLHMSALQEVMQDATVRLPLLVFLNQNNFLPSSCVIATAVLQYVVDTEDREFAAIAAQTLSDGGEADLDYKVLLDPSFIENPCLSGVYEQLGGAETFQDYLDNFDGDFSVANLKLSASSSLPNTTNAETTTPQNYLITITFNSNNLDRPALSIARTFIHELIHAEIYRKLLSVAGQPNIEFTQTQLIQLKDNYPGLYDYYMRYEFNVPEGQPISDTHHEMMAQHYRDIIVQALKQFDNSLANETYEAIAWEGLKNTVAWNNLTQTQKNQINNIISNFENSNSNCQ